MNFSIPPSVLEMGMGMLGFTAGQLKQIDDETKRALVRFLVGAFKTGDANGYIKERLRWLEERDRAPEPRPEPVRATSRPIRTEVRAEVIDDDRDSPPRRRRR